MKPKSELPSSMLFADASDALEEEDPQIMKTLEMKEVNLPMMSLIKQVSRTTSLSPKPETLSQWDCSHTSSMATKLEQKHSLLSTSGILC